MFKILLFWISSLPIFVFAQNNFSSEWRKGEGSIELPSVKIAMKFFREARLFYSEKDSTMALTMNQEKIERLYYLLQRGELNKSNSSQRQNDLYKSQYDFLNKNFPSEKPNWKTNKDSNAWTKAIFDIAASMYIYGIK